MNTSVKFEVSRPSMSYDFVTNEAWLVAHSKDMLPVSEWVSLSDANFSALTERYLNGRYSVGRKQELVNKFQEETALDYQTDWKNGYYTTSRDLNEIAEVHELEVDTLLKLFYGKTVLDVGCGGSDLHKDVQVHGVDATVIGLDLPRVLGLRDPRQQLVAGGSAHQMPIKDSSVDVIISTFGAPAQVGSPDRVEGFYNESIRVLKVGGILVLNTTTCINQEDDKFLGESYVRSLNILRSLSSFEGLELYGHDESGGALRMLKVAEVQ